MSDFLEFDGSLGEGGGQLLRSALALSVLTAKPVRFSSIRSKREKPGLQPQHLAGVNAMAHVSRAKVWGNRLGSSSLEFLPSSPIASDLSVNIGTAGSVGLLIQQLAPLGLLVPLRVRATGGTDVAFAPSVEFVSRAWIPFLHKTGCRFDLVVNRRGYFPAGGGRVLFSSKPVKQSLKPVRLGAPGVLSRVVLVVHSAGVPRSAGELLARRVQQKAESFFDPELLSVETDCSNLKAAGSGMGVDAFAFFDHGTVLCASALSMPRQSAESLAGVLFKKWVHDVRNPRGIDAHLADQVLLYAVLAKGQSEFLVQRVTRHLRSNAELVQSFFPAARIEIAGADNEPGVVRVGGVAYDPVVKTWIT